MRTASRCAARLSFERRAQARRVPVEPRWTVRAASGTRGRPRRVRRRPLPDPRPRRGVGPRRCRPACSSPRAAGGSARFPARRRRGGPPAIRGRPRARRSRPAWPRPAASISRRARAAASCSRSSSWARGFEFRQRGFVFGVAAVELGELRFAGGDLLGECPPIDEADLRPQMLQPRGALAVAPGLAGLRAHAAEPAFDLVDDVGEAEQILLDALQPPRGRGLLGLEPADAGRLFEDQPAVAGRRLQQHVDLALLDDAVGLGRDAGAGEAARGCRAAGRAGG